MLVFADGRQVGTLGGGCVEAEVKRRAIAVLHEQQARILRFQLDHDYGWDDGLICGGRMIVLVDPVLPKVLPDVFVHMERLLEAGEGGTLGVVYDLQASGLPETAMYVWDAGGTFLASARAPLVEGQPPAAVQQLLRPLHERPRPYAAHGISFLPQLARCRLLIVGGGHVGQAVAELAVKLDFDVWVVDDRAEFVSQERFPGTTRRIAGNLEKVLREIEITPSTYCLIVTRGHNHDEQALFHLVNRGAGYVGMIGSRRKIRMIFDDLIREGIPPEALAAVHAPVGLDIGSQTVPEIAVSIAAELVAHRNLGARGAGREASV